MRHRLRALLLAARFGLPRRRGHYPSRAALADLAARWAPTPAPGLALLRLGGAADGGYLVPDDLAGLRACFSPGVAGSSRFEAALAARGVPSHLMDPSVDGAAGGFVPASFTRAALAASSGEGRLSLEDWVAAAEPDGTGDLLLQMDIEGAEYASLIAAPRALLARFRVIVIELHGLHLLGEPAFFTMFEAFSQKLLLDHGVVHLHPNNDVPRVRIGGVAVHPVLEVTLLRRGRPGLGEAPMRRRRHPLDAPNLANRPDVPLAAEWGGRPA